MNSTCTVDLLDRGPTSRAPATGFWHEIHEKASAKLFGLVRADPTVFRVSSTTTSMSDLWSIEQSIRDAVATVSTAANKMLIHNLGWTGEQAIETRLRLLAFEEDWDAPGMEIYDEL